MDSECEPLQMGQTHLNCPQICRLEVHYFQPLLNWLLTQPDFGPEANLDVPMEQKLGESSLDRF